MRVTDAEVDCYRRTAIAVSVRPSPLGPTSSIRVASTLLSCSVAAAVLNELGVRDEPDDVYKHINVHNPSCPLWFDAVRQCWRVVSGFEDHPVCGINWAGASLICHHLGGRLPLEWEWNGFASANDPERTYPWGDEPPTPMMANFGEHFGGTSRVGSFPPTELGLYDLAGNLSEWCQDRYTPPGGVASRFERVVKGGAWSKDASFLQIVASRGKWERLGTTTIGFRPVWDDFNPGAEAASVPRCRP